MSFTLASRFQPKKLRTTYAGYKHMQIYRSNHSKVGKQIFYENGTISPTHALKQSQVDFRGKGETGDKHPKAQKNSILRIRNRGTDLAGENKSRPSKLQC